MPHQNYPQVFACLGMVLGLYGVLYLEVARVPERGWVMAAVGLTGKVFGPIGLARLIWSGIWRVRTGILSATNDLIWWIPFGLYLYDTWPVFRRKQMGALTSRCIVAMTINMGVSRFRGLWRFDAPFAPPDLLISLGLPTTVVSEHASNPRQSLI